MKRGEREMSEEPRGRGQYVFTIVLVLLTAFICCLSGCIASQLIRVTWWPRVEAATSALPNISFDRQAEPQATPSISTAGNCPDVAIRTEPQGLAQADGSFIAQFGTSGCTTVFEGRAWEAGKGPQSRHDIVMIEGARDGFRYWEGNGWLLPGSWDPAQFACQIWANKQDNWKSQGINPLPVGFWNFDEAPCSEVRPR